MMKTFIILPAFNESIWSVKVLRKILEITDLPIIVIDDGSTDETFVQLKEEIKGNSRVILLRHKSNKGKSTAMKTGVKKAIESGAEAFIFIDADGQHNPKHLVKFIRLLKNHDVVFGYRELGKQMPWVRRYGNIFAKWLIRFIFKINRKDLLCGFFAFRLGVYDKIKWQSVRYGAETEIAVLVALNKINFYETKIDTIYIDRNKGVTIMDAIKILKKIPFWYLRFKKRKKTI